MYVETVSESGRRPWAGQTGPGRALVPSNPSTGCMDTVVDPFGCRAYTGLRSPGPKAFPSEPFPDRQRAAALTSSLPSGRTPRHRPRPAPLAGTEARRWAGTTASAGAGHCWGGLQSGSGRGRPRRRRLPGPRAAQEVGPPVGALRLEADGQTGAGSASRISTARMSSPRWPRSRSVPGTVFSASSPIFLLPAGEAFLGGAADRVGDGHHQAAGHGPAYVSPARYGASSPASAPLSADGRRRVVSLCQQVATAKLTT